MVINRATFVSGEAFPALIIRFYGVGFLLFVLPWTRGLFVSITALSLLLVFGVVFSYQKEWNSRIIGWFLFIILSSFLLEMAGIISGRIFGSYHYEEALGWKIQGTPLLIGLNWLFLVYASRAIVCRWISSPLGKILAGTLLMVGYDGLMEVVAPVMHMWQFDTGYPPPANFFTWFVAGFIYHTGFEILQIRVDNAPARWLFAIQWLFFLAILCYTLLLRI